MTRRHIKIQKSLDSILEIVDNLKETIKDGDYKKIMDKLKIINDNNKEEKKFKQYKVFFLLVSVCEDITNHTDECNEDEVYNATHHYSPMIETIRQKFRMTYTDYMVIKQKLENSYGGIRYIHGICDCNPIIRFMDMFSSIGHTTTTKISSNTVEITKRFCKRVRLMSIEEV